MGLADIHVSRNTIYIRSEVEFSIIEDGSGKIGSKNIPGLGLFLNKKLNTSTVPDTGVAPKERSDSLATGENQGAEAEGSK